jgi:hypothetical protein
MIFMDSMRPWPKESIIGGAILRWEAILAPIGDRVLPGLG